jgi:hypothetical protein
VVWLVEQAIEAERALLARLAGAISKVVAERLRVPIGADAASGKDVVRRSSPAPEAVPLRNHGKKTPMLPRKQAASYLDPEDPRPISREFSKIFLAKQPNHPVILKNHDSPSFAGFLEGTSGTKCAKSRLDEMPFETIFGSALPRLWGGPRILPWTGLNPTGEPPSG